MKTVSFILLFLSAFATVVAQTVRRVSGSGLPGANVYLTAQAAHDAATTGDVLLIDPGYVSDLPLLVTKRLKIYGHGYSLNFHPTLSADDRSSLFDVVFTTGSAGSELYGIEGTVDIYGVSDIRIESCHGLVQIHTYDETGTTKNNVSGCMLNRNFLFGLFAISESGYTVSDITLFNNIFFGPLETSPEVQNWVVKNNTFTDNSFIGIANAMLENNVCDAAISDRGNVTYSFNVCSGTFLPDENGNINNADLSNEFLQGTGSLDSDDDWYVVSEASFLKTAASDGGEVGAFGGDAPYILSGIPPIPRVSEISIEGQGGANGVLTVTIDVQSNK